MRTAQYYRLKVRQNYVLYKRTRQQMLVSLIHQILVHLKSAPMRPHK
jgi:hypothetical protein